MNNVHIKIKLAPGTTMPTRATSGSVGYDVTCHSLFLVDKDGKKLPIATQNDLDQLTVIQPKIAYAEIHTGVHVQPEKGYYVELVPNSRLGKLFLVYGNSIGIIDPDYTGGIRVLLNNTADAWYVSELSHFLPGNVVGQLIIRRKYDAVFEQVEELEATERGEGGFGSTAGKETAHD